VVVNKPVSTDVRNIAKSVVPELGVQGVEPIKHNTSVAPAAKHQRHIGKALRTAGIISSSSKKSKIDGQDRESAESSTSKGSTLTECLLSLSTCIRKSPIIPQLIGRPRAEAAEAYGS
jgi:hypothetical protein